MALAQYRDKFWFPSGAVAANIPARVFEHDDNTFAQLYTDATGSTPLANPARTDAQGYLTFWAEEGAYWLHIDSEAFDITVGASDTGATEGWVLARIQEHAADTTDVHGIADTTELETKTGAQAKADTARNQAEAAASTDASAKANLAREEAEETAANALAAHAAQTTNVHGIANTADLLTEADLDNYATDAELAAHAAATTNVHGIADTSALVTGADLEGLATDAEVAAVQSALTAHATATTDVHGIADTAELETKTGAQAKADAAQTTAIDTASGLVTEHENETTNVHGIADTSALETQTGAQDKADAAQSAATSAAATSAASLYVPLSSKGAANGVPSLDANSLVPAAQVPLPHEWQPADLGLKAWVCNPALTQSTGIYPGSGNMRMAAVVLRRTETVNRVVWHFHGYAGGLQSGSWVCVWRASTGERVGHVPNLAASGSEPAEQHGLGGGASYTTLSQGTVTLPAGVYYIGWRMVYNTTTGDGPLMLALENAAGAPSNFFGLNNQYMFGYNASPGATAPTTMPALDVGGGNRFWVALA